LSLGSSIPKFNLKGVDGKSYTTDCFSDKAVLLVIFSCNHCPYVQAYEDRIIELQKDYIDKSLQIVTINPNDDEQYPEDSFKAMIERANLKKFNFPYLKDDSQLTAKNFGASHTPEIFMFDKQRKLVYIGKIDDNWQYPERVQTRYLRNAIDELLNDKEVSVPETFAIGCTIKWKK
jgi:thiol-disulfide isomerase/thioredoxin